MLPKKAAPKRGPNDEADPFEEFVKRYAKNRKEYDAPTIPAVNEIIKQIQDDGEEVKSWNFPHERAPEHREFDPMAFRVLFHSLRQVSYNDIEAIRVWKCCGGDESVRSVCYYLDSVPEPNVKDVHFTNNGVTALGCEFLSNTLGPNRNKIVNLLRLDYNQFGTPGVLKLSAGLSQNCTLRQLSLNYCAIGEDGGQYLAHILMFVRNALEILEVRGNHLKDAGVVDLFQGARRAKALTTIDVFDNKFTDSQEVIQSIRELFANNTVLTTYNLGGNQISDSGASMLVNGMIGRSHLAHVMVTERCSGKTFEAIEEIMSKGKKKGKKKKGKK